MSVTAIVASVVLASASPPDAVPAPAPVSATDVPAAATGEQQAPRSPSPSPSTTAATEVPLVAPPPPPKPYVPGEDIVVSGHTKAPPGDPMEQVNAKSFEVITKVDEQFVAPIATGYEKGVPRPVRMGLRNFISNLTEPVNFLNYLLQFKPGKAVETLGRFTVNSTIGVAGLVDVARSKPFNLPYRHNGLANTLGFYGVGPGPYLFLPLVGPTTVRDLFGLLVDRAVVPVAVGKPFNRPAYTLPVNTIESIDDRNQVDADLKEMRASDDPYTTYRQMYLKTREYEIEALHGRGPLVKGEMGVAPFARPLGKRLLPLAPNPAPTGVAPASVPAVAEAPVPVAPPAPTFVSIPVVQPIPAQ